MPQPQPPRVTGPLANQPGANSGSGGKRKGKGNPSNPNVQPQTTLQPCLISWPSTSLPLVGSVGGGCLLSKTNVRAWVGGGLIVFSAVGGILAAGALIAVGFKRAGAFGKAADIAGIVPGGQAAALALRGAQGGTRGTSQYVQRRRSQKAASERRQERQLGEPRENRNLRTGRGAVRETKAGTAQRKREAANDAPPF